MTQTAVHKYLRLSEQAIFTEAVYRYFNHYILKLVNLTNDFWLFFLLKVKNIYIHNEMFSIENGLLTPTLKAKRSELKEFFKDKIEQLYSSISMWRPADLISLQAS